MAEQPRLRLKDYLRGRQVDCVGHARDRYDRLLAVCYAGGESINDRLVREGWALDYRKYSTDYLEAEAEAKRRGVARTVRAAVAVAKRAPLRLASQGNRAASRAFSRM